MRSGLSTPEALKRAALLHTDAEPEFDRITRLAARILSAPTAIFSVADDLRVYVKSIIGADRLGISGREFAVNETLSAYVVASRAPLVIPDVSSHPLVTGNPALRLRAAAYAAVPVKGVEGSMIGVLAAADSVPRDWSGEDLNALSDLAAIISREVELRRALLDAVTTKSEADRVAQAEASEDVLCVMDAAFRVTEVGARAFEIWGYPPKELRGRNIEDLLAPSDARRTLMRLSQLAARGGHADFRSICLRKDGTQREVFWTVTWSTDDRAFYAITRHSPAEDAVSRSSDKRILVVDDYREIALLVRTALLAAGFANVEVASGPSRALDLASVHTFDLVISDLRMQPLNGVDLLTRFRKMPGMEKVPFLIISGYANRDVVDRMAMLGVNGFIAKPFRTDDLVRHVRRALAEGGETSSGRRRLMI